jgi:hypothetical protein
MPYGMRKIPNKNCYKVFNKITKKVFSKCSSLEKAEKQLRLLKAIKYNKNFIPYGKTRRSIKSNNRKTRKV